MTLFHPFLISCVATRTVGLYEGLVMLLMGIFLSFVNGHIIFSATEVGAKLTAYLLDHVIPRWSSPPM